MSSSSLIFLEISCELLDESIFTNRWQWQLQAPFWSVLRLILQAKHFLLLFVFNWQIRKIQFCYGNSDEKVKCDIFAIFKHCSSTYFFQYFILNKNLIYLQQKTSIRPKRRIFCSCLLHLLLVLFGVVIQCNSVVLMLWSGCPKLGGITCVMMWVGWIYRRYHRQTWQSWRQLVNHHYYLQLFKTWNG